MTERSFTCFDRSLVGFLEELAVAGIDAQRVGVELAETLPKRGMMSLLAALDVLSEGRVAVMMGSVGQGDLSLKRLHQMPLHSVCLEHGKDNPRPKMKYRLVSVEEYTDNVVLQDLIRVYASGRLDREVAQVAAWRVANNLTWQQLATKRVARATGPGVRELS